MTSRAGSIRRAVRRHFELTYSPGTGHIAQAIDARIAPDGDRVAFTATIVDDLDAGATTHIALVEDGSVRILQSGTGADHDPRWSPDGRTIAFLSDRDRSGLPQLVLIEASSDWAEPDVRRTPPVDGAVESLEWGPDGRFILLCVADPGADQGDVAGPGERREAEPMVTSDPVGASEIAGEGSRAPSGWRPTVRDSSSDRRSRGIWIVDVASDTVRRLTSPSFTIWEATWRDSSSVVAIASDRAGEGAWFGADLRQIEITTGETRTLHRPPFQIGKPLCSPSGRHVAFISGLSSDRGNVPGDLVVLDIATGTERRLDGAATDVTDFAWLDDERLGFIGLRELETVAGVASSALPSEIALETWRSTSSCGRHIARASFNRLGQMAVVNDSYTAYAAVTIVDRDGARVVCPLAPVGIDDLKVAGGDIEEVGWEAPDGMRISGWLCRPAGRGPFPLILMVHGGPVGATTNAWTMGNDTTRLHVSRGHAVLHPNPRGSHGRGQAFVHLVLGDMGGADAEDLLSGVEAMIARGVADPARLAVVGTSYGGFMANLLPTRTDRFSAAVAMSPVTDWDSFQFTSNIPDFATLFLSGALDGFVGDAGRLRSPLSAAARCRTPTLEVGGHRDLCTPFEQASRFYDALCLEGTQARLVGYPEAGHGVQHIPALMDLSARVLEWLDWHLAERDARPRIDR
ncbi:MAG: prolyl oligopeptidase family serine peptidase [Candidatus Limnocylindrales bacterium]